MTTDKYPDDLRLDKDYEQINHPNGVTTWKTKPKHKEQAMNREDIIQPIGNLLIGQPVEPSITFHPGDPAKEVMRIDKNGVKVNPEYSVDEATQHVLSALTAHIQHTVNNAVAAEREACAKAVLDDAWALTFQTFGQYRTALAAAIRARSSNE